MKKEPRRDDDKPSKRGPKKAPSRVPPPPPMFSPRPTSGAHVGGSAPYQRRDERPRDGQRPGAPRPYGDRSARPSFGAPRAPYGDRGPRPSFGGAPRAPYADRGPRPSFGGAPRAPYADRGAPRSGGYGAPRPHWEKRGPGGAQQYDPRAPRPSYNDRGPSAPRPEYGAPRPAYGDRGPRPSFGGAPRAPYNAERGPRPSYGPSNRPFVGRGPEDRYRAPVQHSGAAPRNTSWGGSAQWYDEALEKEGTYQKDVILPNLLRLLDIKAKDTVADVACGQGFFSRAFAEAGAKVRAVDVSPELVAIANEKGTPTEGKKSGSVDFSVAPAHETALPAGKFDHVTIVMAVQNIRELAETFAEAARLLAKGGTLHVVMNHPAFRVPKRSAWGFDHATGVQFRRVDAYLSDSIEKIVMHPGNPASESTASFHRPLQAYVKALGKAELAVTRLEEWISNRQSQPGARAEAENRARSEFPLFLYLQAKKI